MNENRFATQIIGGAIEVHRVLGPGLLETAYHECLKHELEIRKLHYESEIFVPIRYKGIVVGNAYQLDLLVENEIIVELKAIEKICDVHKAQLLTYLRLTSCKLGLLINFNVPLLKYGVTRIVNNL